MPERHTIDFDRGSFNVLSDSNRGIITLQTECSADGRKPFDRIVKGIKAHFGSGPSSRLARWWAGRESLLVPSPSSRVHPDDPNVLRYEIGVKAGEPMDSALLALFELLGRQPGYRRTIGPPLDRDLPTATRARSGPADASTSAHDVLRDMMDRRRRLSRSSHQETKRGPKPAKSAGLDPDF